MKIHFMDGVNVVIDDEKFISSNTSLGAEVTYVLIKDGDKISELKIDRVKHKIEVECNA